MAHFENEIIHLYDVMIPPLMSSTMSSEAVLGQKAAATGNGEAGRPEKKDSEKSEKTIKNQEAMS
jgi:hypothetical protein